MDIAAIFREEGVCQGVHLSVKGIVAVKADSYVNISHIFSGEVEACCILPDLESSCGCFVHGPARQSNGVLGHLVAQILALPFGSPRAYSV